jgi:hypothetical protein
MNSFSVLRSVQSQGASRRAGLVVPGEDCNTASVRSWARPTGLTENPVLSVALSRQVVDMPSKTRLDYGILCKPEAVHN